MWDVPPSRAVAQDHIIFQSAFDSNLPVLDIGCGSGIQTGFLGSIYSKVYGIDASRKVISAAQKLNIDSEIHFVLMNLLDENSIHSFHEKTGDTNIYLRGVLHQIPIDHRPEFIKNIKHLMGKTGTIYLIETATNIQSFIQELADTFSELPDLLKNVLTSNFPPLGVSLSEVAQWFDTETYEILNSGKTCLHTNLTLLDGSNIELPAIFVLIKNQHK